MIEPVHLLIRSQSCWLSPARCLFWEENKTLVVGGFQLGRLAEPTEPLLERSSLERLEEQILFFKADRALLLGGFPLPENNRYVEEFMAWRKRYPSLSITTVLARSTPIAESLLAGMGIQIQMGELTEAPFRWVASRAAAEKWKENRSAQFMVSGYQDPGYKSYDAPRQAGGTPCFFLTPDHALLPSFSKPRGIDSVKPGKDQLVWLCESGKLERKT